MTITFKQYLDEGRGVPKTVDEFIKWANANCSAYIAGNAHLYRGFKNAEPILIGSSVGEKPRKSVGGIPNNYTLWIDNHPRFKGFPKRSSSFIATTNANKADDFGTPYLMFCPDDVKIAQVLTHDIWLVKILPSVLLSDLNEVTETMLKAYGLHDNEKYFQLQNSLQHLSIKRIEEFKIKLRWPLEEHVEAILDKMKSAGWHDMWDVWNNLVKPELFSITDGKSFGRQADIPTQEVWVEGTCGFISLNRVSEDDKSEINEWLKEKNPELGVTLQRLWKQHS